MGKPPEAVLQSIFASAAGAAAAVRVQVLRAQAVLESILASAAGAAAQALAHCESLVELHLADMAAHATLSADDWYLAREKFDALQHGEGTLTFNNATQDILELCATRLPPGTKHAGLRLQDASRTYPGYFAWMLSHHVQEHQGRATAVEKWMPLLRFCVLAAKMEENRIPGGAQQVYGPGAAGRGDHPAAAEGEAEEHAGGHTVPEDAGGGDDRAGVQSDELRLMRYITADIRTLVVGLRGASDELYTAATNTNTEVSRRANLTDGRLDVLEGRMTALNRSMELMHRRMDDFFHALNQDADQNMARGPNSDWEFPGDDGSHEGAS